MDFDGLLEKVIASRSGRICGYPILKSYSRINRRRRPEMGHFLGTKTFFSPKSAIHILAIPLRPPEDDVIIYGIIQR